MWTGLQGVSSGSAADYYYFGSDGAMKTGWQKIGTSWYYFKSNGSAPKGWYQISKKWYYFYDGGAMATGLIYDDGYFFMSDNGTMVTGWKNVYGDWYYFGKNGKAATGFKTLGGKTYYFSDSGVMQTGIKEINGIRYNFDNSGCLVSSGEINPEITPEVTPEITPEITPMVTPVVTPAPEGHFCETAATCDGISFVKAYTMKDKQKYVDLRSYDQVDEYMLYVTEEIDTKYLYVKYNGDEGYRDIGDYYAQSFPDYSDPQVVTWFDYKHDETVTPVFVAGSDSDQRFDYMTQQGYNKYIILNIRSYILGKHNLSFDIYYKGTKIDTVTYSKNNVQTSEPRAQLKKIVSDVSQYKENMTDGELISAVCYWIRNHSYDNYTCFACHIPGDIMKMKGHTAWLMSCSKRTETGAVNDYYNYYSVSPANKNEFSGGHRTCIIMTDPTHYVWIEVEGSFNLKSGETNFSKPWTVSSYDGGSIYRKVDYFRDYDNVYDMVKGDFGIDITTFDPYDCTTWF